MIIKKELIKREIAGDTILVPVGKAVYDANGLFALNELGAFIWELLPRVHLRRQALYRAREQDRCFRQSRRRRQSDLRDRIPHG